MSKGRMIALAAVAGAAAQSSAAVILTYGFTDLNGSFDRPSMQFSAVADDLTAGDVSRLAAPNGTADFDDGFVNRSAFANVVINLSVFNLVGNMAQGSGTFAITDDDGDVLEGNIDGIWIGGSLGVYFNGDLSNVSFDTTNGDGVFEGTDGGSFGTVLPGIPPYEGTFIQLFIRSGGFFNRNFTNISTQASGEIVPTPGAIALLGIGALAGARRRKA